MKHTKILLYVVFAFSLILNTICFLPYKDVFSTRLNQLIHPEDYKHISIEIPDSAYIKLVLNKSLQMNGKHYSTREYQGLFKDIKTMFSGYRSHNETLINPFNIGYLYAGLSYYALNNKSESKEIIDYLNKISSQYENDSHDSLNYKIENIIQVPYGIMHLNLYKLTKLKKHLRISTSIYKQLLQLRMEGKNEIPYLPNSDFRYVDGLGMFVPFLMEYYELTGDTLARKVAKENIRIINRHCVDKETGIPHHGYNPNNFLKLGSANWGRGIGWYLLALSYCNDMVDDKIEQSIAMMDYTQFPGQPYSIFDTSTALMFEIFKQSRDDSRTIDLSIFKSHTTVSGMIDDCSGDTYSYNQYSKTFSKSEICNGLFLILVSKFSNNGSK